MIRYIPPFILQNYEKNVLQGTFEAYVLLIDIADFTKISTSLQKEGKQGAEELSMFLDVAFGVPTELVNRYGGFVSLFAGDAFCAIFPGSKAEYMISVVNKISSFFREHDTHETPFGEFDLKVRQTICYGDVDWKIYVNELQNEYVFSGDALKELVELSSLKADVTFSGAAVKNIGEPHFGKLEAGYYLISKNVNYTANPLKFQYTQKTIAKFINPKYITENPQNEIRSAAYCFANLERIEFSKREQSIATVQNLVDKYGGFVNKYDATDKGLIAIILFGLPKSEDKTLERICAFSLDTVVNLPGISLGISAGSVFAGYTGRGEVNEYTALGHPMNMAERLMSRANAGEVLADIYLWQEMQANYDFDYLGTLNLKGFDLPLRYYSLSRPSKDKTWHHESRFVGREEEIFAIRNTVDRSFENNQNTIIYVSGDAGIGKTRLVKEALAQYPANAYHKFYITCDAILPKPLEAIKQITRTYFYFNPQLPAEVGIGMFKGMWAAITGNDTELQRIESIIASLLDYEWEDSIWSIFPPEEKPTQLMRAFICFMEQLTKTKSVLIHLDDGQWLDKDSMIYLQEMSKKAISPICIVSSCRYLDNGEKADLELPQCHRIDVELNSLLEINCRELIGNILRLPQVPEETSNLIINRAMGNPFFIEQLTSYLMESNCINDKGMITGEVGYLSSFSISDIISSRIDRLTENVRECMFNASVLGMQFNVKVLAQMLNHEIISELEVGTKNHIWKDLDELSYIFSHILIKDVIYQRMMSETLQKLHQTAAEAMEIIFADKLNENAEEIAHHFEKGNQVLKAAEYFDKAGCFFTDNYDFQRSEINLQRALQIRETILGEEHPDTADSLNGLAVLYYSMGKNEQAEPLFLRILEFREKVMGAEHPDTADSLNNLGLLYLEQGKYEQAELLILKALKINKKVLGVEHPDTAHSMYCLAGLYYRKGKVKQAEILELRALKIREKVLGGLHPATADSLNGLAGLYYSMGKNEQAEPLLLRILEIREKVFGAEHPKMVNLLNNLAMCYEELGKYEQAEQLCLKALGIRKKVLGVEHPDTAHSMYCLASLYYRKGKVKQAELLDLRALKIREKVLGGLHPDTADSLNSLAVLYYSLDKNEQAEPLFLRALDIREKVLGAEHPDTAYSLNNLGMLYCAQGKYEQAELLILKALKIDEKVLGAEHPDTAQTMFCLAWIYCNQGKFKQAESLNLRALEIREKVLGVTHPRTIKSLEGLADLYQKMGLPEKAAEYKAKFDEIKNKDV
jgi:tetratricopeptide (TPR) repeat protein/class 3 adenylate cyclase